MNVENLLDNPRIVSLRDKLQVDDKKLSVIIVIFLASLVFADFRFLIKWQFEALKKTEPKILRLKMDLDGLGKGLSMMKQVKQSGVPKQASLAAGAKKLISEAEIHSLYQDISEIANKNNVKIVLIRPSRESNVSKEEKDAMAGKLTPLSLALDIVCDYQNLISFIGDLESFQTLLVVQNIRIAPQQEDSLRQKVDLVLKTYLEK